MSDRPKVNFEYASADFNSPVNVGGLDATLNAAQVLRGLLHSSPEENNIITLKLPGAAELIAAFPKIISAGYCWKFSIRNDGRSVITVEPGKGGSINGHNTVPVSQYAMNFVLRFTSVTDGNESYVLISN